MKETNLVKKLVQHRIIEATQKNINAKLILVARMYGSPVMGSYYDAPLVDTDWERFNDPTLDWSKSDEDDPGTVPKLGFIYDSLKMGVNLEIVVMAREKKHPQTGKVELDTPTRVRCSYKGYTVYHEEDSKLICYAPFPEWEEHLNKIYNKAIGTERTRSSVEKQEEVKQRKKATQKAMATLRKLWGI